MSKPAARDTIYALPQPTLDSFCFDARVAAVFPDMINRSVPGYALLTEMLALLAQRYVQPESAVYDLGCSLGAATVSMQRGAGRRACRWVAVDNSPAMCARCRTQMDAAGVEVDIECADVSAITVYNASLVVLNFTLQFIAVPARLTLLRSIYHGLRPGGVLVLSEKLALDTVIAPELGELHLAFKRANGYSELEIAQKRAALEHVLLPDSLEQHQQRLQEAGFAHSVVWFQCLNFVSMLAWKV
jgi:tRNA (cmo5U34)-methyltransferase